MATKTKEKLAPLPKTIRKFENPIPFTENFKWQDLDATFTVKSFTDWTKKSLPIIKNLKPMTVETAEKKGVKIGDDKVFYLRKLPIWHYYAPYGFMKSRPTRTCLGVWRGETQRQVSFDGVVSIPVLANSDMEPWMSLTPNEVFTLRGQIRRAKKDVAVAGLGLGWVSRKILERKQVDRLTIYEKDKHLIEYFGQSLIDDFGDRVSLVHADAYEVDWFQHDVALWDIWKGLGNAAWDKKYKAIRSEMISEGKTCIGWGEGYN